MPLERTVWDGAAWVTFAAAVPSQPSTFVPGVTMPQYVITPGLNGAKNVGNIAGTPLTAYLGGAAGNGALVLLPAGTYTNIDFGDRRLNPQGTVTLNNCRVVLTTSNFGVDGIGAVLQRLNGPAGTMTCNDCEFHNRAQRMLNCFMGRNTIFNRCVFTGGVDGVNCATTGNVPSTFDPVVNDCWIGDLAWWYYTSTGVVHPSDTNTHNDGSQIAESLGMSFTNTFFGAWPSEYVGTGTPGCGTESNPYVVTYIVSQATMNGWRAANVTLLTRADQSFEGVARKTTTGGSWSGLMCNSPNGTVLHCWFSGGTVQINLVTATLPTATGWSVKQCTFWNDMSGGHTLPASIVKGVAIYTLAAKTYDIPTSGVDRNLWFDGTTVTPSAS